MELGSGATACFWLEPSERCVRRLRRFATGDDHLHDAQTDTGIVRLPVGDDASVPAQPTRRKRGDPPWPAECVFCGYRFKVGDPRRVNVDRLYRDPAGREFTLAWAWMKDPHAAPPGAMWDAKWLNVKGYDGISLVVRCPNGMDWHVDMPSSSGGSWKRTGDPRRPETLTVSPSIAIGQKEDPRFYHGHLQAGRLTAHIG